MPPTVSGVVIGVILAAGPVLAETSPRVAVADPTLTSSVSAPTTAAVFRASAGDTEVAIQASKAFAKGDNTLALGLKISGPVSGSSSGVTQLATLDDLDDATTVELNVSGLRWKIAAPDPEKIEAVCLKYLGTNECKRSDLSTEEAKREFDDAVDYGYPVLLHVAARVGYQSLDYLDSTTLNPATLSGYPWAATAGAGFVMPSVGYLGVGYRREHSLTPKDSIDVCKPLGQGGATACSSAPLGAPDVAGKNLVTAEARLFWSWLAINPSVTFDLTQRVTGIQAPLYFVKNADGGLIAGITPSWRSDTKDLATFVFVGGTLGLLPPGMSP